MQSIECSGVSACLVDECLSLFDIRSLPVNLLGDNIELLLDSNIVLLLLPLDLIHELLQLPLHIQQWPIPLLVLCVVVLF